MKAITLITTTAFILLFANPNTYGQTLEQDSLNFSGQTPIIQDRMRLGGETLGFWEALLAYWYTPRAVFDPKNRLGL